MIDAAERYSKSTDDVDGISMAYVEAGAGRPVVFLHGKTRWPCSARWMR